MTTTARTALLALVALLAAGLLLAVPAAAAEVEVRLTADGPVPADVALPAGGGTVRFVVDDAVSHTLVSDGFAEQQLGGLGGQRQVELEFRTAGAVAFTDRRNRLLAPQEQPGSVTVAAAAPAEPPAVSPPARAGVTPAPDAAQESVTAAGLPPVQAVEGPLPGEPTSRPLGLPVALAVLAALGVASLIVRVLLAEPVAQDR